MKYSFMSFSCPDCNLDELFTIAEQYGYDGLELRLDSNHKHNVETTLNNEQRNLLKQKLATKSIKICTLATSCRLANPNTAKENIKIAKDCIKLAHDLNVPTIRVFGGSSPKDLSREKTIENVAHSLKELANYAADNNVYVCMETHDDWINPHHIAKVMELVNEPFIRVNWDILHPVRTGFSMDESFKALKPWIKHVHIHDSNDGTHYVPIGTGMVNHNKALELLKTINYTDYLSGEWINWEDYNVSLPRELKILKGYERKLEA